MTASLTQEEIGQIRHNFRRCREGTSDAIIDLRRTGDIELIPTIVRGIVWRYVREETQPAVEQATPETPLGSLGIDSLTMMEIVLDMQDALNLTIEDADLKQMKTIGDVIGFLQQRFAQVRSGS
ncbi:MAG TPA: phosphopantetheine-binding protein [Chthoniobacterales bacterium]|nr:phosphopantetheine-binding protein [Chthoniobacterales bacterium]